MILEAALVEYCSPTLAGVKVGNMFRYFKGKNENIYQQINECEKAISKCGIKIEILHICTKTSSYLLYVYREKELETLLNREDVSKFMKSFKYERCENCKLYISNLSNRILAENVFPHEVGIFLGYPLCDVEGFIRNNGKNFTCAQEWKSYSDPRVAIPVFHKMKKCKEIYKKMFDMGKTLSDLAI